MSLAVSLSLAVASAIGYGASTAVQHSAVADHGEQRLAALRHNPRWWMSIGGDTVGVVLQLAALATGPVVLVQPLFVLCLPVALPVRARFGGPRPTSRDYAWAAVLGTGLALFFLLAGSPAAGRELTTKAAAVVAIAALVAGGVLALASRVLDSTHRAVTFSAVAGAWFGVEAVLVNAVSTAWSKDGLHAFERPAGLVPLVGLIVLGLLGFVLTQIAFRLGSLPASLPAMLVTDPFVAVVLGALVLGEAVRSGPFAIAGYVGCAALIVLATVRLASPLDESVHATENRQ